MGTLNNRCCIIIGTQKGTIILTTTHIGALINQNRAAGCILVNFHQGTLTTSGGTNSSFYIRAQSKAFHWAACFHIGLMVLGPGLHPLRPDSRMRLKPVLASILSSSFSSNSASLMPPSSVRKLETNDSASAC